MSSVDSQERLVKQLKIEANIKRIKVSKACKDLIKYCQKHEAGDMLVNPKRSHNALYERKKL